MVEAGGALTELVHDWEDLGLVFSGVAGENLWRHRCLGRIAQILHSIDK